jgi:hypothetical protein
MSKTPIRINLRADSWEEIISALELHQWMVDEPKRSKTQRLIREITKRVEESK